MKDGNPLWSRCRLSRNRLNVGDKIEYLTPGLEDTLFKIDSMKDLEGACIDSAKNEESVFITIPKGVRQNDLIRRYKGFRDNVVQPPLIEI
ncbi:MAG: U32 family peptidase C-terminal domain-containing protein [Nitrospirae bacterium]|nr:U32 family peptidase C-terminal domain-containing protein [Nitrospirota bacterium]